LKARLVAGIDSSTQSCKVVVCDAQTGTVVRSGRASHAAGTEVDPETWWAALSAAVHDAGGLADVAAVSVAAQQHGLVALDSVGRVIRPALLWNDTRSAEAAHDLTNELGAGTWAARAGVVPVASFTAAKLRWMSRHEPGNAARTAAVALPHDWLTWRLRGYGPADTGPLGPDLDALTTDASDASGTAYWSPRTRAYDQELFSCAFGRPMREAGSVRHPGNAVVVPRIVHYAASAGVVEQCVSLPSGAVVAKGTVIGAGAGDNAAAALGLDLKSGDVVVSLGTSGTVFGVTPRLQPDPSGTVAGFADATGGRLPIVTTLNGAGVLDIVAGLLDVTHEELGRLALQAPSGADGLVLVPYFMGERTPNLPDATASLSGMTPVNTTRHHVARAAIEGMLGGLAEGLTALERNGVALNRVLLIGGAARNEAVARIGAAVFGRDVEVPHPGEYVALGAARQAAWVLSGVRPVWPITVERVSAEPHPEVLRAFRDRVPRL
jgi:xylulokinase